MTQYEEALKRLRDGYTNGYYKQFTSSIEKIDEDYKLVLSRLSELEGREAAMKPRVGTDSRGRLDFFCKNCDRDVVLKEKYCSHCGQRLDFGGE